MVDIQALLQYLYEGDILGFLQAVYVSAFRSADLFYAFVMLLFTTPLYIRTRSFIFLAILWILLGGFFLVATPLISGLAVLLLILGLATLFFKLFMHFRS